MTTDTTPTSEEQLVGRLVAEFPALSRDVVARSVADVWRCAVHLGLSVTPLLVERMAREQLIGLVKSEPPSGSFHTIRPRF